MKIYTVLWTSPFGQQVRVYKTIEEAKENMERSIIQDFNDYREGNDEVGQVSNIDELQEAIEQDNIERTEDEEQEGNIHISRSYNFWADELYTMELVEHEL